MGAALAQPVAADPGAAERLSDAGLRASASVASAANLPAALPEQNLAGISGGQSVQIQLLTNQNLNATVQGNAVNADTVQSGAVNFGANALNGFNGIGNFVINTGNNNVLQGSLSVTIMTAPSP